MMPIEVHWDHEVRDTISMVYKLPWTWEEFQAAYTEVDAMFKSVPHRVDLIIDIRNAGFPPSDALPYFRKVIQKSHANLGTIAFVGAPFMVMVFAKILSRLPGVDVPDFQFFPSMEAAEQALTLIRKSHV